MTELVKRMTSVVPSPRQIKWQETEFYAFIHYGVNQFTDREWGDGQEDPQIFDPRQLDTDQWCASFAEAGMKGAIITAKHHDGFCLWATQYTTHCVTASPYKKDIVAQVALSCRKYGLKLGIYLSPWDRHDARYGQGKEYDDYFCNQLTELLTGYGDVFCVWFDGACGEGPNGKKQVYDWSRYYAVIRQLQPEAVISVCGPDVRWCGNEAGHCRASEWSVVPASMVDNEKVQEKSQKEDDSLFRKRIPSGNEDLGSRDVLKDAEELIWYPAEVNTSIRPGWFYHQAEDESVRSLEELTNVYLQSAGGNATFLLNIPPHPQGYIAPPDVQRLREIGAWLKGSFGTNLLADAAYTASSSEQGHGPEQIGKQGGYWKAEDDDAAIQIIAQADGDICPQYLTLQEEITQSQRIEAFTLSCWLDGEWKAVCEGTVVGYKRICPLPHAVSGSRWRVTIPASRGGATLKTFALY